MTHEVLWSQFLRRPAIIEPLLKAGDVVLKRRDGPPLRLSRASRGDQATQALSVAARILGDLSAESRSGSLETRAATRVPWTRFLTKVERRAFVTELLAQLEACADIGDFSSLGRLVAAWKGTAAVHAAGAPDAVTGPEAKLVARTHRSRRTGSEAS